MGSQTGYTIERVPVMTDNFIILAYLDPGTGSFVFQLMIGFLVGLLYAAKIYWSGIMRYFKKIFARGRDGGKKRR